MKNMDKNSDPGSQEKSGSNKQANSGQPDPTSLIDAASLFGMIEILCYMYTYISIFPNTPK